MVLAGSCALETLVATYRELLAELAGQLHATSAVLELSPSGGAPLETIASCGPPPREGDELTRLLLTVRDGPAEVAQLRLAFSAGAAQPTPSLQRLLRALLGLLVELARGQPDRRAGRRFLAVSEEELQRIILDVHDGPVQKLFAALSQLELLKVRLASGPEPLRARMGRDLDQISSLVESSLGEIKTGLGTFRPPEFRTRPLVSVLKGLVMQHEALTGMHVDLQVDGAVPEVTLPVKIALYRILQESLSNVSRHAKVDRLDIRLCAETGWVVLRVHDAGRGFSPPPLDGPLGTEQEQHIGLRGMRERTELVAGKLTLISRPGEGTSVEVRVPADV